MALKSIDIRKGGVAERKLAIISGVSREQLYNPPDIYQDH
jgi:hypothetical protein